MDVTYWYRIVLGFIPMPVIEAPILVGLALFALTWLSRGPWVTLPGDTHRRLLLTRIGIWGSLSIVAVATTVGLVAAFAGYDPTGVAGWWRRPAPVIAAALVIGVAALLLAREPLPAPGERAIMPRRHWWSFAPKGQLWLAIGSAVLLALTSVWQGFTTTLLPTGAQMIAHPTSDGGRMIIPVAPSERILPDGPFVDNPSGGGWLNNGVTLAVLAILFAILITALAQDANRPIPARSSAPSIRESREATAKILVALALGGTIITLGMLWMFVGYLGGWQVTVEASNDAAPGLPQDELGLISLTPDFAGFAGIFRFGGWFLQGVGVALLLRLAVDIWRTNRRRAAQDSKRAHEDPTTPSPTAAEAAR